MIEGILVENRDVIVPEGADQGPGALLKQARVAAGISIEEAATFLHLAREVISALENNNFQGLPALTFARGYLRAYAKFLNVDAQQVINEFNKLGLVDIDRIPTQKVIVKEFRPSSNPLRWLSYLIAAGLVSLVILWWHNHSTMQDELASNAGMISLQSSNTMTSDNLPTGTADTAAASTAADVTTESPATAPAQDVNNNLSTPTATTVATSTSLPQATPETNTPVQNATTTQSLASSPQDLSASSTLSNENANGTSAPATASSPQPSAAKTAPSSGKKKISTWSNPDLQ